jgi:hypothetical protein
MSTFGNTTGTGISTQSWNNLEGGLYTLPENGIVVKMSLKAAYFPTIGKPNVKLAIVRASDLTIIPNGITKSNLISNPLYGSSSLAWIDFYFETCPYLTAGDYYLCVINDNGGLWRVYNTGVGTRLYDSSNNYNTPIDPTDADTSVARSLCIYATYYTPETFTYQGVVYIWDGASWVPKPVYENDPGFTEYPVYACLDGATWSLIQSF